MRPQVDDESSGWRLPAIQDITKVDVMYASGLRADTVSPRVWCGPPSVGESRPIATVFVMWCGGRDLNPRWDENEVVPRGSSLGGGGAMVGPYYYSAQAS